MASSGVPDGLASPISVNHHNYVMAVDDQSDIVKLIKHVKVESNVDGRDFSCCVNGLMQDASGRVCNCYRGRKQVEDFQLSVLLQRFCISYQ